MLMEAGMLWTCLKSNAGRTPRERVTGGSRRKTSKVC
jgi:hypothetical protein